MKEVFKEIDGYDGDYLISNYGRVKSFKGIKERILEPIKYNGYFVVHLCKNRKSKNKRIHVLMYEYFINKIPKGYVVHHKDENKLNNSFDNFQPMLKSDHTRLHHKGTHHSDETKKLISEGNKGKKRSEETLIKMREKHHSDETKKLISKKTKGENNPFHDKKHSEKTKELMRENHADFKGDNHPQSKLTEEKVIEIRIDLKEGILNQREIGEKFGVCNSTISMIKRRKIWKHIK